MAHLFHLIFPAHSELPPPDSRFSHHGYYNLAEQKPMRLRARIAGFTLIEIMIVLAIISIVMAIGLPAISRVTYQRVNSQTRKFIGVIRTIRNASILLNTVQRLAFDLDHGTWWVEQQKQFQLLTDPEFKPKKKSGKKQEETPSNFQMAEKFSKKPIELPQGVAIEGVLKEREGFIKEGIAYVHFFPNGFTEQALIYINKEGSKNPGYTLWIRPSGGRVDVYPEYLKGFDTGK